MRDSELCSKLLLVVFWRRSARGSRVARFAGEHCSVGAHWHQNNHKSRMRHLAVALVVATSIVPDWWKILGTWPFHQHDRAPIRAARGIGSPRSCAGCAGRPAKNTRRQRMRRTRPRQSPCAGFHFQERCVRRVVARGRKSSVRATTTGLVPGQRARPPLHAQWPKVRRCPTLRRVIRRSQTRLCCGRR